MSIEIGFCDVLRNLSLENYLRVDKRFLISSIRLLATFKDLKLGYSDFIAFICEFSNLLLEIDSKISFSWGLLPTFISLIWLKST